MMQSSADTSNAVSSQNAGSDYKDGLLEQYKKTYVSNRRLMWIMAVLTVLLVIFFAYSDYKKTAARYDALPTQWKIEGKMTTDSSGRMVVISTINDSNTRRILVSADKGIHFVIKGGPWDSCNKEFLFLATAPDNQSFVAADGYNVFIKGADRDTFTRIKLSGHFHIENLAWVPDTDSVYVYGETSLIALNYKRPDSLIQYEFFNGAYYYRLISLAVSNGPQRSIRAIVHQIADSSINSLQYLTLDRGSLFSLQEYAKAGYLDTDSTSTTTADTTRAAVDSAINKNLFSPDQYDSTKRKK